MDENAISMNSIRSYKYTRGMGVGEIIYKRLQPPRVDRLQSILFERIHIQF